jgi:hypothetical protein
MTADNIVLEIRDDERDELAALARGAAERIRHLDTYSGITPEIAKEVSDRLLAQKQVFEISHDHLSALYSIVTVIEARALDTAYIANIPQERYASLEENILRIYDEVYPSQAEI